MYEISFPFNISFTFDGDVSIVNISERIRDFEIEKLVLDILKNFMKKNYFTVYN